MAQWKQTKTVVSIIKAQAVMFEGTDKVKGDDKYGP